MVKKLLFFVLPLFLLVFVSTVNAQNTTGTSSAEKLRLQLQEMQAQKRTAASEVRQEAIESKMNLRNQIKETIAAKREAVKETVAARKESFRTKLEALKDAKKKVLVERIDTKLETVNTKHTNRFTEVLGNLQIVLDKVATEIDKTAAQAAIDAAKLAVENQAAKTYTITISTETALKSDVGTVTSQLRQDLVATHKLMTDAKQAVQTLRASDSTTK